MFEVLNQYSYPLIALISTVSALLIVRRGGHAWRWAAGIAAAVLVVFVLVYVVVLRPGLASDADNLTQAQAVLTNGRPTLLEFYSNYCTGCLTVRPLVDALVERVGDQFNVLRIDIHTQLGRDLRAELGFDFTPEFVLYNAQGREVWRGHLPPTDSELNLVYSS